MGNAAGNFEMPRVSSKQRPDPVGVMPNFPDTLGPFAVVRTPFIGEDFRIMPKAFGAPANFPLMGEDEGTTWLMEKSSAERAGIDVGDRFRLEGRFSPRHQVTLKDLAREAMRVPEDARTFVWSYPVEGGWRQMEETDPEASAAGSFLGIGGFVYLDREYKILAINTLMADAGLSGHLHFSGPRPWRREWTEALSRQRRFQPVTIQALADRGASHFCWLRPGEFFPKLRAQPSVPHGGFVYLFGADLNTPNQLDRYFAVLHYGGETAIETQGVRVLCNGCGTQYAPFKLRDTTAESEAPMETETAFELA